MTALKPSAGTVELALARVVSSAAFRGRPPLRRLLAYVVQHSLAGIDEPLK